MEVKKKIPTMEGPAVYRIHVSGRLNADWSDRVGGMTVTTTGGRDAPDTTTLEGRLPDQAALTGVMNTPCTSCTCRCSRWTAWKRTAWKKEADHEKTFHQGADPALRALRGPRRRVAGAAGTVGTLFPQLII